MFTTTTVPPPDKHPNHWQPCNGTPTLHHTKPTVSTAMALQRPEFWFWWFDLTAWPFAIAKQPYSTGGLPCNWLSCILPVGKMSVKILFSKLPVGRVGRERKAGTKGVSLFEHCLAGFCWTNTKLDKSQRWIGGMAAVPWKHDTSCYKESSFDEVSDSMSLLQSWCGTLAPPRDLR